MTTTLEQRIADLDSILPERNPLDKRDNLTRLIRHRDQALRSVHEIATAAQEAIDAHPELLTPYEDDRITPMDNLLIKIAVWEQVDADPPMVFTDPDTGKPYISLQAYEGGEA